MDVETSAETAYLFRHALMRDAAYELQLPGDRARLHTLAFELIEQAFGGRAPEPPPLDAIDPPKLEPHTTDSVAHELAGHAKQAVAADVSFVALQRLYLRRAAEHADSVFQVDAAVQAWQQLGKIEAGTARGEAMRRSALALDAAGRNSAAEPIMHEALAIHRETGNQHFKGIALYNLAGLYRETGRVEAAEQTYGQALAMHRDSGSRRAEGVTLAGLAILYQDTGRVDTAEQAYGQALAILRETGNRRAEGVVLGNLASLYQETGRADAAEQTHGQALAIHRETGNRRFEGVVLGNLALLYQLTGRVEIAERSYGLALAIHRETGSPRSEGISLGNLAGLYQETGRVEAAERTYEEALSKHRETANRLSEGVTQCDYAVCQMMHGRLDQARQRWREGVAVLLQLNNNNELERRLQYMRHACARAGVPPIDTEGAAADQDGSPLSS